MIGAGARVLEEGLIAGRAGGLEEEEDHSRGSRVQSVVDRFRIERVRGPHRTLIGLSSRGPYPSRSFQSGVAIGCVSGGEGRRENAEQYQRRDEGAHNR